MSTCKLFLGTRHVTIMLLQPDGLTTETIADTFRFTATQSAHLHLIGIEPLLPGADASAMIRFVYDGDLGTINSDDIEIGGVYRLLVEDRRAALLPLMASERREEIVREFNEMGAVANMISPAVVIEFFSKQTDLYLSASTPLFAANAELARNVRRTIRDTMCSQISALLEQDVGNLGTITLDNYLAYKAWTEKHPKAASPRPSLRPTSPRSLNALDSRSIASLRLQKMLSRNRHDDLLSGVWDPKTDVVRSGPLDVKPMKKGSVVEIITDAGANDKPKLDEVGDDEEEDDDDLIEAGDDDDSDQQQEHHQQQQVDDVLAQGLRPFTMIDGVRHQFVLHSSNGQSINTVYLNVAKRHVVLASRGMLTTRKTVIPFAEIRRCDDGAERDALCFSIVTGRRTYHLQTSTARERDVWVAALREVVAIEPRK